jgi:hypothetical protein
MKTSVELNGYIVSIEEENGVISVTATKDEEVVEEFTIQTEEGEDLEGSDEEGEDVRLFGDEEEDFEGSDDDDDFEGSDDDDDDDDDDFEDEMDRSKGNEAALESFQSFISKKK